MSEGCLGHRNCDVGHVLYLQTAGQSTNLDTKSGPIDDVIAPGETGVLGGGKIELTVGELLVKKEGGLEEDGRK